MDEEDVVQVQAMAHPGVMIASDGGDLSSGTGHPRGAGSLARVLGVYVREQGALDRVDAVSKMTLLPAQRMEAAVPGMLYKGRIQVGADADVTIFDPVTVIDNATFDDPAEMSSGIPHVLVDGATPGRPIRRKAR